MKNKEEPIVVLIEKNKVRILYRGWNIIFVIINGQITRTYSEHPYIPMTPEEWRGGGSMPPPEILNIAQREAEKALLSRKQRKALSGYNKKKKKRGKKRKFFNPSRI